MTCINDIILFCAKNSVTCVSQSRTDVRVIVQAAIHMPAVQLHIRCALRNRSMPSGAAMMHRNLMFFAPLLFKNPRLPQRNRRWPAWDPAPSPAGPQWIPAACSNIRGVYGSPDPGTAPHVPPFAVGTSVRRPLTMPRPARSTGTSASFFLPQRASHTARWGFPPAGSPAADPAAPHSPSSWRSPPPAYETHWFPGPSPCSMDILC